MDEYIYRGDKFTAEEIRGVTCSAYRRTDGKCVRGRNGNMLVVIGGRPTVVLGRQLRKLRPHGTDSITTSPSR
jgi:hypothetical protein